MATFNYPKDLLAAPGTELGTSRWFEIDQARIDGFGLYTEDQQWIHVDPERAAQGPFGSTIAHGYLTLSLAAPILFDLVQIDEVRAAVNYGVNKARFLAPVPVGSRVRGTVRLLSAQERGDMVEAVLEVVMEIEGGTKPACIAELVVLYS